MIAECGERAIFYDAVMQRDDESFGIGLVNSNVRNICGIDMNDNNDNNYLVTPKREGKTNDNNFGF